MVVLTDTAVDDGDSVEDAPVAHGDRMGMAHRLLPQSNSSITLQAYEIVEPETNDISHVPKHH